MNSFVVILLAIVAVARSNDLTKGENNNGTKIFDEKLEASPAVWRQAYNLTVNTTADELINKIIVTDLRPYKDGEAKIVDGGVGQSTVTFELKSPTALRGYSFQIEVYAENKSETYTLIDQTNKPRIQRNTSEMPISNEPKTNLYETKTPKERDTTTEMHGIESSSLPSSDVHFNPTVQPMVPLAASLDVKDVFEDPENFKLSPSEVVMEASSIHNHPRNLRDTEGLSTTEEGNLPLYSARAYNPPTYNHTAPAHPISVVPSNIRSINNTRFGPQYKEENDNTALHRTPNQDDKNTPIAKDFDTLKPGNNPNGEIRDPSRSGRDTQKSTEQPKIVENSATTQEAVKIVPGIHEIPEDLQGNKPTPKALSKTDDLFTDDFPKAVMV